MEQGISRYHRQGVFGCFCGKWKFGGLSGIAALIGDNQNTLISINATINLDKNGNFLSVRQGDRTLSIKEFNELFTRQNSGQ